MVALRHVLLAVTGALMRGQVVDFHFEVGCPVCGQVLSSTMQDVLKQYGTSALDVRLHPFGNSYYPTSECGNGATYDLQARKCWDAKCGSAAAQKLPDCFGPGEVICQHGTHACALQNYLVCAKDKLKWQQLLPFANCIDKNFNEGEKYGWPAGTVELLVKDCAGKASGLDFEALKTCAAGPEGKQALMNEAKATPPHKLVPFATVDGTPLPAIGADPSELLSAIAAKSARRLVFA